MRFVPHADDDVREMLAAVGVDSLDDLFAAIPDEVRFAGRLDLPEPAAEADVLRELTALAARNRPATSSSRFLGGGVYDTYVPAVVDADHEPLRVPHRRTRPTRPSAARACCRPSSNTRRRSASSPGST